MVLEGSFQFELADSISDELGGVRIKPFILEGGLDPQELLARIKSPHDGALPAGNGVQALNLLRLAELTGEASCRERAEATLAAFGGAMSASPRSYGALLVAFDFAQAGPLQIVVSGKDDSDQMADSTTAMYAAISFASLSMATSEPCRPR